MKILSLKSENVKKIKVVEITPDGNTVIISGANAAGKTSVLDSIWLALGGKDATKSTTRPIRDGETHAEVTLDLGEYIVKRTWNGDKTTLKIENKEGAVFKSPQAMLDKLTGKLSFDPLAFSLLPEKEQLKILLDMIDLPINLVELDEQRLEAYGTRTLINRGIKTLEGQRDGHPIYSDVPDDELSAADVMGELQAATEQISANDKERTGLEFTQSCILACDRNIAELQDKIQLEKNELYELKIGLKTQQNTVTGLIDPDLEQFKCKLEDVEQINKLVRGQQEQAILIDQITHERSRSQEKTAEIDGIDRLKSDTLQAASMPVDGLSFDAEGVTYQGVPMKQCSSAEQLRVSMAMAMAANPTIRVIRITDGSLLDTANMAVIQEMADTNDFQVWIECVNETGDLGIYIEDGMIVHDNYGGN